MSSNSPIFFFINSFLFGPFFSPLSYFASSFLSSAIFPSKCSIFACVGVIVIAPDSSVFNIALGCPVTVSCGLTSLFCSVVSPPVSSTFGGSSTCSTPSTSDLVSSLLSSCCSSSLSSCFFLVFFSNILNEEAMSSTS